MKLSGEILILILMICSNGRVLFTRKSRLDSLVMLAPLSFLLSFLMLFAFPVDLWSLLIFLGSILLLLSNFHALFRYSSRLIVDHYSLLMKSWAGLTIFFSLAVLILILIFRPVDFPERKTGVVQNQVYLTGTFGTGFSEAERFSRSPACISEFTSPDSDEKVIVFFPDKRGDTYYYKPFLQTLAQKGFTVYSGDFYVKDCRWLHSGGDSRLFRRLSSVCRSMLNPQMYESQREFYTFNFSKELEAMTSLVPELFGHNGKLFVVTDSTGITAARDFYESHMDKVSGIFDISSVPEYSTPGYGFVQQTDPFLARFLGTKHDREMKAVTFCVEQTEKAFASSGTETENENNSL